MVHRESYYSPYFTCRGIQPCKPTQIMYAPFPQNIWWQRNPLPFLCKDIADCMAVCTNPSEKLYIHPKRSKRKAREPHSFKSADVLDYFLVARLTSRKIQIVFGLLGINKFHFSPLVKRKSILKRDGLKILKKRIRRRQAETHKET